MKILYWTPWAFFEFGTSVRPQGGRRHELRRNIILVGLTFFFIASSTVSFATSENNTFVGAEKTNSVLIGESQSPDSTSVQKAKRDLQEIKKHVNLTKVQEEVVYRLFLGNHLYLEDLEPSGERWETTMRSHLRRFREELGEEAFLELANKGLVKSWFGFDQ